MAMKENEIEKIDFFGTAKLLIKNMTSVLNKVEYPSIELYKEVLSMVLKITEKQLAITEIVIKEEYDDVILSDSLDAILVNMLCVVTNNGTKKIGKITSVDSSKNKYSLTILGENRTITVTRDKFNI